MDIRSFFKKRTSPPPPPPAAAAAAAAEAARQIDVPGQLPSCNADSVSSAVASASEPPCAVSVNMRHKTMTSRLLVSPRVSSSDVSLVTGRSQKIVAFAGDSVTLPCHLKPEIDASALMLEWARPDLSPGFVHVWANNREYVLDKQPSYRGRTSLFTNKLQLGDISLKLFNVTLSDEGTYRCRVPQLGREAFVTLVVCVVSTPVVLVMSKQSSAVELECKSAGWYPEPEVLWLDGEGNLLSAGPTETVRGPDGLYTVSSRVTLEERHNNFTCRVQLTNINQSRETWIHVPVPSRYVKVVLVLGLLGVVLAMAVTLYRWHKSLHIPMHGNYEKRW